ncbi:MAG: ATP-binding protein [Neomegalonema sp.]|nr:ATP-binding protein [Neomegalonema sp.]
MANHRARALAGAALGVLITSGLWFAMATGERSRTAAALTTAAAETSLGLQRSLASIAGFGVDALRSASGPAPFEKAADRFAEQAQRMIDADPTSSAARMALIGSAELRRREGAPVRWELRRARIGAAETASVGAATESLRVEARRVAGLKGAAGGARRGSHAPHLISASGSAPRFWILWSDDSAGVAFAALFELKTTAAALGVTKFKAPKAGSISLGAVERATAPTSEDGRLSATIRFALGDTAARLPVSVAEPGLLSIDRSVSGPISVIAAFIFGALFLVLRFQRRREEELNKRQRTILESIAEKQTELEQTEARFRHLAESTNVIFWRADLDANRFTYVGPQIEELSGYPASTWRAEGFWLQHILPQDRKHIRTEAAQKAKELSHFTLNYRIRNSSGDVLHIHNILSVTKTPKPGGGEQISAQGFMLDMTEQVTTEEKLKKAHDEAEKANEFKSAFLATMSHELRTPLNAVIGFSEIMKDQLFGPLDPQYQEYAASVHASGKHLLNLINDILDISKIEAGRFELHEAPTELDALLMECRTLMQERITSAGLELHMYTDPGLPQLLMDERRIKQVLLNLLSNAQKFTEHGGEITLAARRVRGQGVTISVKDTGVGMTPEEIPLALESFGQIAGHLSRQHDGTGLGLPIARSLTQLHGGELSILSEKGVGTEIIISMPESRIVKETVE